MSTQPSSASAQPWRTIVTSSVFTLLFAVLVWRLYDLQVVQQDRFHRLGERQVERAWTVKAPRGEILDAEGAPLVVSSSVWYLYADPGYMNDKLAATVGLSEILGVPRDELRRHFEAIGNGRLVAKDLNDVQADAIRVMREAYQEQYGERLAGIHLRRAYRRSPVNGALGAHALGFVLQDGIGGAGIEQACDVVLSGHDGRETYFADARGRWIIDDGHERIEAQPGANVQVTLVAPIQQELENALLEAVEKHDPESAAGIIVRPRTGEIVAMASWPSFDPTDFRNADPDHFRNNVLSFVYESGSTMKPLVAGAAVADQLYNWDSRVWCENGKWTIRRGRRARTIHDHSFKHGGHQWLTVAEGVAKSDNILMAKLGLSLGVDRLHQWIDRFGFGQRTGIELAGEDYGMVLPLSRWTEMDSCVSIPMGHEIAVTPLQMVMAHAAVANNGVWNPPRLIRRIYSLDRTTGREIDLPLPDAKPQRRVFKAQDADAIEAAMSLTMTAGTGTRSQLKGWSSAGKTGTTEKLVDGKYADDRHIGSFVCWTPAEPNQAAEFVALVVIDDPKKNGHYGSQTAAPVVQRVLQFAMDREFGSFEDVQQ